MPSVGCECNSSDKQQANKFDAGARTGVRQLKIRQCRRRFVARLQFGEASGRSATMITEDDKKDQKGMYAERAR